MNIAAEAHEFDKAWNEAKAIVDALPESLRVELLNSYAKAEEEGRKIADGEGNWFRAAHRDAKERNAQIPAQARMIVTDPTLSAHTRATRKPLESNGLPVDERLPYSEEVAIRIDKKCRDMGVGI